MSPDPLFSGGVWERASDEATNFPLQALSTVHTNS